MIVQGQYLSHKFILTLSKQTIMKVKINGTLYSNPKNILSFKLAEPILVEVTPLPDKIVFINGNAGDKQYIQLNMVGSNHILIHSGNEELRIPVKITPIKSPRQPLNKMDSSTGHPFIQCIQDIAYPDKIQLQISSGRDTKSKNVTWQIGEDTYTGNNNTEFDINKYLKKSQLYTNIDVSATVKGTTNGEALTGKRTLTLWNEYEVEKSKGRIRPAIAYNELIRQKMVPGKGKIKGKPFYEIELTVTNIEKTEKLILSQRVIEYMSQATDSVYSKIESVNETIPPTSQKLISINVDAANVPKEAFAIAIHFQGTSSSGKKVSISAYAEIADKFITLKPNEGGNINNQNPVLGHALSFLDPKGPLVISHKELTKKVHEKIAKDASLLKQEKTKQVLNFLENPNSIHKQSSRFLLYTQTESMSCNANEEGETEIFGLDEYVCQLVPDGYEMVHIPARIINAKKGDILLTPSGNSLVGKMMLNVFPTQYYSHCGIMVENFSEVRHSTASEEWYIDNLTQDDDSDIDINIDGVLPDAVKYGWPGIITQSVSDTYYGEKMTGRQLKRQDTFNHFSNKEYIIKGFSQYNSYLNKEPKVVKPSPFDEAADYIANNSRNVRSILKKVAEASKNIDGHYRFYCYSKADIFFDNNYQAPDDVMRLFWANNPNRNPVSPTVCSSFIWAAIKNVTSENIVIEGTLESEERNPNSSVYVETDNETADGLYLYTEPERRRAALSLYNEVLTLAWEKIENEAGSLAGLVELVENISVELGNQFCNAFASDFCDERSLESTAWENPGVGRAVSPDDILNNWDGMRTQQVKYGLYGYNERLVFRPERYMIVPKYKWVKVRSKGIIKGKVVDNKGNYYPNLQVNYTNNHHVITDANGNFEITQYAGNYTLTAHKEINGYIWAGEVQTEIRENITNNVTLILESPKEYRREVTFEIIAKIYDWEIIGGGSGNYPHTFSRIYLDLSTPNKQVEQRSVELTRDEEVRAKYFVTFTVLSDCSVRADYTIQLWEADGKTFDFKKEEKGTFIVPRDTADFQHQHRRISDDGDWVETTFVMHNLQYSGA